MNKGHIQAERAEAIAKALNTGTQQNVENVNRERLSATLTEEDDLQWAADVHGIDIDGVKVLQVYGNEDCPARVEAYAEDHYLCPPVVYLLDDDTLTLIRQ